MFQDANDKHNTACNKEVALKDLKAIVVYIQDRGFNSLQILW